jgi:hypothetical protein
MAAATTGFIGTPPVDYEPESAQRRLIIKSMAERPVPQSQFCGQRLSAIGFA